MSKVIQNQHLAWLVLDVKACDEELKNRAAMAFVTGDVSKGEPEKAVKITYEHLMRLTNRAAHFFKKNSRDKRGFAVLRLDHVPEFPIAFLGAVKAGVIPVPVSPHLTQATLKSIFDLYKPEFVVSQNDGVAKKLVLKKSKPQSFLVACSDKEERPQDTLRFQHELLQQSENFTYQPSTVDDVAYVQIDVRKSGKPKSVIKLHKDALVCNNRKIIFSENDVVFHSEAFTGNDALCEGFLKPLQNGGTSLVYDGPLNAINLVHVFNKYMVSVFYGNAESYQKICDYLKDHKIAFPYLKKCFCADGKINARLRLRVKKHMGFDVR